MRSLYEKLNRLDDSLVESKKVVKKKKLTESDDQVLTNNITIALIDISGSLLRRKQELKDRALKDGADRIIFFDEGLKEISRQSTSIKPEINVVVYTNNDIIEDPVLAQSNFFKRHPNFKFINVSLNNSEEKITESVEDEFDYSDFIPEEMTQFFCINEEDNEDPNEYMPKGYRGYKAVASLIACGDYTEDLRNCGYQYALLINDPADNFFVGYVAGDRIYKLTEEDIYDEIGIDYDDDIDEMLREQSLTEEESPREKLMNTYPDEFGHWEPYNRNPVKTTKVAPKTLDQYARDPETEVVEFDHNSTNSFKELGARKKLLKAFPDLKIEAYEPLEEAIKDSDYVIVLTHPNMPQDKRYSYFGSNYRMTRDLNKAMTYPGEFSAKDEIKYALDATDGHWDPSYADRFSVMTIAQVKELLNTPKPEKVSRAVHHNPSAQEAAKPIAKEIHEVIKNHNVSLSSFLKLITEIIKSEDPSA